MRRLPNEHINDVNSRILHDCTKTSNCVRLYGAMSSEESAGENGCCGNTDFSVDVWSQNM